HLLRNAIVGSALLAGAGAVAQAQVYGGGYYDNGRFYGEFGRDDRYPDHRGYRGGDLFARVRGDLHRAQAHSYSDGGTRRRFNRVREELGEFQGKLASGRYDRHELDDAIGALQKVVSDNRLDYRDREVLQEDLFRLREFRSANGYYRGGYYRGGEYRDG